MPLTGETTMDPDVFYSHARDREYLEHLRAKHAREDMKTEECKCPDPNFRIGQLEEAIKGALPYLEQLCALAHSHAQEAPCFESDVEDGRKVIAKLKELIEN